MKQEQPSHRHGEAGYQQADGHERQQDSFSRKVGALDQPCGRQAEQERYRKRDDREAGGVPEDFISKGFSENFDIVIERIMRNWIEQGAFEKTQPKNHY